MPTVCVSIQGGGSPTTIVELFDARGWWIYAYRQGMKFTERKKPSGYYNPVT